jgi:hypothetical protein
LREVVYPVVGAAAGPFVDLLAFLTIIRRAKAVLKLQILCMEREGTRLARDDWQILA